MSCNGCRVLRKGCSETCILRSSLQWIGSAEAQGHATVFVAKFFGRAGLMAFISAVPENQRPALFQSLLFEAAGRSVNPVNGAVGLMWTGNWHVCQAAVETVLRGCALRPISELLDGGASDPDDASECTGALEFRQSAPTAQKWRLSEYEPAKVMQLADLDLSLTPRFEGSKKGSPPAATGVRRVGSPSMNSEESATTSCGDLPAGEIKILNLFN